MESNEELDLLPTEEQLAILRDLAARYGVTNATALQPLTECERHRVTHGHRLAFGCCSSTA